MATESPGFFSDPKTILALLAIAISLTTLVWSLANQTEQNRRWDAINAASIELSTQRFQRFRVISRKEFYDIDWGYKTTMYGADGSVDQLEMINCLVPRDSKTGELIPNFSPVFTIKEASDELRRVSYSGKAVIKRLYRPMFYFRNNGKSNANNLKISVAKKTADAKWETIFSAPDGIKVFPGQEINTTLQWEIPLEEDLPKEVNFRVSMSYEDIHGKVHTPETLITWTSALNYWVFR